MKIYKTRSPNNIYHLDLSQTLSDNEIDQLLIDANHPSEKVISKSEHYTRVDIQNMIIPKNSKYHIDDKEVPVSTFLSHPRK